MQKSATVELAYTRISQDLSAECIVLKEDNRKWEDFRRGISVSVALYSRSMTSE